MFPSISTLGLNGWAILVAGLANIIVCLVLYLPKIFGNAWVRLSGKEMTPSSWMPAGVAGHMLNALGLAVLISVFNAATVFQGITIALLGWAGFFVPIESGELVWEKIPFRLFLIKVTVLLISECITAIILVLWR